jgi:hypothetical protein
MKNNSKYILVGVLVFIIAFVATLSFTGTGTFGSYARPFGHGWGMGSHMMGGWGISGIFGLFGGFGMLGMWLIPLLTLGLIVAGIVWVIQTTNKGKQE